MQRKTILMKEDIIMTFMAARSENNFYEAGKIQKMEYRWQRLGQIPRK